MLIVCRRPVSKDATECCEPEVHYSRRLLVARAAHVLEGQGATTRLAVQLKDAAPLAYNLHTACVWGWEGAGGKEEGRGERL